MSSPGDLERVRALTSSSVTDLVQTPVTQLDLVRGLWTSRRLVQAAVLWPVLLLGLGWLAAPGAQLGLLAVATAGAALALVTYLPVPGQTLRQAFGGACGIAGLCLPIFGANALSGGATGGAAAIALGMVAFGLVQRALTASSCGVPGR
ncbi:MAG: hypothetical protein DCC50_11190 [Acidobacteria bacterium]|nr:MAG: hypothetical protein DCC50_11190 [Acidobacteriota bacterium]